MKDGSQLLAGAESLVSRLAEIERWEPQVLATRLGDLQRRSASDLAITFQVLRVVVKAAVEVWPERLLESEVKEKAKVLH